MSWHGCGVIGLSEFVKLLLIQHTGLGAIKHIGVQVALFARHVHVGVAVGQRRTEAVAGVEHLELLVLGQGGANQVAAIAGDQLQVLSWLDVVQVNRGLGHASGDGGHRREQTPAAHFNPNRVIGERVVNQVDIADAQRQGLGCKADTGTHIAGVVGVLTDAEHATGGHAHRVLQQHADAA